MDLSLKTRLRLGVSSCLVGEEVRYDGGHKRDHWVADRFGPLVEWVSICPEAEAGLGTPREPIQLESVDGAVRVRGVDSAIDHTDTLSQWSAQRIAQLDLASLDGYVFKAQSPSCGVEGVPVFEKGGAREIGRTPGVFAAWLHELDPLLPTCNEDDVQVPEARRQFLERVQFRARFRCFSAGLDLASVDVDEELRAFADRHETLLLSRSQLALNIDEFVPGADRVRAAGAAMAERLSRPQCIEGHVAALAWLHDRLERVPSESRWGLALLIDQARLGEIDVEVPRQLARGLVIQDDNEALAQQYYLDPIPTSLRPH